MAEAELSRVATGALAGAATLAASFSFFWLVRTLQPDVRAYSFAAMCVGLIAGPCAAAPVNRRLLRRPAGAGSLALGGIIGGLMVYSQAIAVTGEQQS